MSAPEKPKSGKGGVSPRAKLIAILVIGALVIIMFVAPLLRKQPTQSSVKSRNPTAQGVWTPRTAAAERDEGADSVNRPQLPNPVGEPGGQAASQPPPLANASAETSNTAGSRIRALLSQSNAGGLATDVGAGAGQSADPGRSEGPPVPISAKGAWASAPVEVGESGQPQGQKHLTPQQRFAEQVIRARERAFLKAITSKIPVKVSAGSGAAGSVAPQISSTLDGLEQERQAIAAERARYAQEYQNAVHQMRLAGTGPTAYHPGAGAGSGGPFIGSLPSGRPGRIIEEGL